MPYTYPKHMGGKDVNTPHPYKGLFDSIYNLERGEALVVYPPRNNKIIRLNFHIHIKQALTNVYAACKRNNIPIKLRIDKVNHWTSPDYHLRITRVR